MATKYDVVHCLLNIFFYTFNHLHHPHHHHHHHYHFVCTLVCTYFVVVGFKYLTFLILYAPFVSSIVVLYIFNLWRSSILPTYEFQLYIRLVFSAPYSYLLVMDTNK